MGTVLWEVHAWGGVSVLDVCLVLTSSLVSSEKVWRWQAVLCVNSGFSTE